MSISGKSRKILAAVIGSVAVTVVVVDIVGDFERQWHEEMLWHGSSKGDGTQ